jgi:hypothetical protein
MNTGISLQTDDIDAYHAQLKDRGVDVDAEVSRFGDAVPPARTTMCPISPAPPCAP